LPVDGPAVRFVILNVKTFVIIRDFASYWTEIKAIMSDISSQGQAQYPALAVDEEILQVTLPSSQSEIAGESILTVATPDGRLYQITVPAGMRAGELINVVVKKSTPSATEAAVDSANHPQTDPNSVKAHLGAAGAGAIVGTIVIGGLITGPLIVGGAALYASSRQDRIGNFLREGGAKFVDVTSYSVRQARLASNFTIAKAKEIDANYDISGKATVAGTKVMNAAVTAGGAARRWSMSMWETAQSMINPSNRADAPTSAPTPVVARVVATSEPTTLPRSMTPAATPQESQVPTVFSGKVVADSK
jgi:hypothetical protein